MIYLLFLLIPVSLILYFFYKKSSSKKTIGKLKLHNCPYPESAVLICTLKFIDMYASKNGDKSKILEIINNVDIFFSSEPIKGNRGDLYGLTEYNKIQVCTVYQPDKTQFKLSQCGLWHELIHYCKWHINGSPDYNCGINENNWGESLESPIKRELEKMGF